MDRNLTIDEAIAEGAVNADHVKRFAAKHSIAEDLVRPADVAGGRKPIITPNKREQFVHDVTDRKLSLADVIRYWPGLREKTADNWMKWARKVAEARASKV